ncbi:TIGR03905 family TSCPD domain-containing protein [Gehongia tenuis]|uniref:ribonucleoside-diphosphate reductase n=1 Tax=Gehongia tenuis TaxID=2763655 RepID=A0A926HNW1_9FIRM|nr:TIGR03905 family TSCPD domain-containing protein [Gehongia tenuis]MBC8531034.1 TIGR03905 family TSCPD domain-containing protein [Gehongia tenuis]
MFEYKTRGTCSTRIELDIDGDRIQKVKFKNGCDGNLQGISRLVEGMRIDDVIAKCEGVDCRGKGTSCPDQLARALKEYKSAQGS